MALPVNKKTLDTRIATDLANNSSQLITAEKLRNTLTPIVNSTFGLKTIWNGWIDARTMYNATTTNYVNNRAIFIAEDYYDPNYFPALDPNNLTSPLADYQQTGCRYKLINQGSNLTGLDGTYVTSIYNYTVNAETPGVGLTFDVKIVAGSVVALKVNNPGTGYCWGERGSAASASLYTPTQVEIIIGFSGGGNNPIIEIDLSRVINMDRANTPFVASGNIYYRYLNLFVPSASGIAMGYGNIVSVISQSTLGAQNASRIKNGACDVNAFFNLQYPLDSTVNTILDGYYASILSRANPTSNQVVQELFKLEIKVPIINTTI